MTPEFNSPIRIILEGAETDVVRRAVAQFSMENSDEIRAIARRKLTLFTRSVHDSEEIFSSVMRRLDRMAEAGRLHPRSEAELWGLIHAITHNRAVSCTRLMERAKKLLTEDGPLAYEVARQLNACRSDADSANLVRRMMASLTQSRDRQILDLRFRGASHGAIATLLGMTEAAVRQQWKAIRKKILDWFTEGGRHD